MFCYISLAILKHPVSGLNLDGLFKVDFKPAIIGESINSESEEAAQATAKTRSNYTG